MESLDSSAITHGQMIKAKAENVAEQKTNVYIWDMDETLILLKSLLNGTYAASFNGSKDVQKGIEIGKRWENHILQVCDEFFFYEQGLHSMLNQEMIKLWDNLYESTDAYTDKWLSSARNFLEMLSRGNRILTPCLVSPESATDSADVKHQNLNVLVTSGSLIPSLVKCLLFRLDDLITHGNVYSSWEVGKLQCFSWIKERFSSPGVQFCVIGDGMEECEAAQMMKWPFIRIDPRPDGSHRFPGLSMKMVSHYLDVIYSTPDNENDNKR
ncbi:eyes absent homolog isoform X2 [Magnolia sinica]|uniref:eyes absent homolog isoform X2 n=1 Tax=Magnolia sinica TaxID=86752 RepID=UPI0026585253|nr:eyes absent homolog isoform X2 [Magnolia sinica]